MTTHEWVSLPNNKQISFFPPTFLATSSSPLSLFLSPSASLSFSYSLSLSHKCHLLIKTKKKCVTKLNCGKVEIDVSTAKSPKKTIEKEKWHFWDMFFIFSSLSSSFSQAWLLLPHSFPVIYIYIFNFYYYFFNFSFWHVPYELLDYYGFLH